MSFERVMIQEYDTVSDAKEAESMLLEAGANDQMVFRTGKKLRVISSYEDRARELLGSGTAGAGAAMMGDDLSTSATTTAYGTSSYADDPLVSPSAGLTDLTPPSDQASGQGVVGSATDSVKGAASSATDTAQHAAGAVGDTVQSAASAVEDQVTKVTTPVAEKLETLADTVEQKGASPDAPAVQRTAAQTVSGVLDKLGQYLRQPEPGVIAEDIRGAVRSHPVRSLLVAFGIGFAARSRFAPSSGGQGGAATSGGIDTAPGADVSTTNIADMPSTTSTMGAGYGAPAVGAGLGTDAYATDAALMDVPVDATAGDPLTATPGVYDVDPTYPDPAVPGGDAPMVTSAAPLTDDPLITTGTNDDLTTTDLTVDELTTGDGAADDPTNPRT